MSNYVVFLVAWFSSIALWLWNIPPAFFAPLVPELFLLGLILCSLAAVDFRRISYETSSILRLGYAVLGILLIESVIRGAYEWANITKSHPLCLSMPGVMQRLECTFSAGVDQNYAMRSLLTLGTGAGLFATTTLSQRPTRRALLFAVQFAGVFFAVCSYLAHFGIIQVPAGRFDPIMSDRFCYLIGNPSWIAPLLAPSLVAAVVNFIEEPKFKAPHLLSLVPMIDVIFRSQQRGGVIIVLCLLLFLMLYGMRSLLSKCFEKIRNYKFAALAIFILTSALISAVLPTLWLSIGKMLASLGFGGRLASSDFVSGERLIIWKAAMSELKGHYLTGYGYATWFRKGALQVPKYGLHQHFDTAHNFFIQYVFEHGLISMTLWVFAMACVIFGCFGKKSDGQRWSLLLLGMIFTPILLFQEIDFIRSGFYISMATIGAVVSLNSGIHLPPKPSVSSKRRLGLMVAGFILVTCSITFARGISLGGYQYEASVVNDYAPAVRWFRKDGFITFVSSKASKQDKMAVYQLAKSPAQEIQIKRNITADSYSVKLGGADEGANPQRFIPVRARGIFDRADFYMLDRADAVDGRQLGMMLNWPPTLTTLELTASMGASLADYQPYSADFGAGLWCKRECSFILAPCQAGTQRSVWLVTSEMSHTTEVIASIGMAPSQQLKVSTTPSELKLSTETKVKLKTLSDSSESAAGQIFIYGGICR